MTPGEWDVKSAWLDEASESFASGVALMTRGMCIADREMWGHMAMIRLFQCLHTERVLEKYYEVQFHLPEPNRSGGSYEKDENSPEVIGP